MTSLQKKTPPSRWLSRLPYFIFIGVALCFAANPFSLLDFPLDDAWIHRVYSQSFAFGHGFEYNPGQQEAGSTSPLWSIVTAPVHWFGFLGTDAVVILVKLFGIALCLASIRMVRQLGILLDSRAVGLFAASWFALDPRLAFSALSGMEGSLLVTLWLGAAYSLANRKPWIACLLMSLTPTTRPESLILLPLFALTFFFLAIQEKWAWRKMGALFLLPIPMLLWSLFCTQANGRWLPTTFYLKASHFTLGYKQLAQAWESVGYRGNLPSAIAILLILMGTLLMVTKRRQQGLLLTALLIIAPAGYIFAVVCGRKFLFEGYYWTRWVESPALILSASASLGLALLWFSLKKTNPRSALPKVIAGLVVGASLPFATVSFIQQRYHIVNDSSNIHMINVRAGEWINENTPPDAIIAINDAGAIRYFGQRKSLDLIGLNYAKLGFSRDQTDAIQQSDWIVIFPSWFHGASFFQQLEPVALFSVPPEEYSITMAKSAQSTMVIYRNTDSKISSPHPKENRPPTPEP